jgi:HEAT repeats
MHLLPRFRRGTWLLAGVVLLAFGGVTWLAFSNRSPPPAVRLISINELLAWLDQQPALDSQNWSKMQLTWEEWFAIGRSIPDLEARLLPIFETGSTITRWRIAHALNREFGTTRSVSALIRALGREESSIQIECAAALGRIGDGSAVDALIAGAESPDINVRINALVSLGMIGGPAAEDCIAEALTDADPSVRSFATHANQLLKYRRGRK